MLHESKRGAKNAKPFLSVFLIYKLSYSIIARMDVLSLIKKNMINYSIDYIIQYHSMLHMWLFKWKEYLSLNDCKKNISYNICIIDRSI